MWWIFTILVIVIILMPIYKITGNDYPYYVPNAIFIAVFITFTRWIFFLRHTFFAKMRWVKLLLIFLPIPIFFYAMDVLYDFQNLLDATGFELVLKGVDTDLYIKMLRYIQYQFIFFGSATMIVLILLPIRMLISIWRVYNNKGTV